MFQVGVDCCAFWYVGMDGIRNVYYRAAGSDFESIQYADEDSIVGFYDKNYCLMFQSALTDAAEVSPGGLRFEFPGHRIFVYYSDANLDTVEKLFRAKIGHKLKNGRDVNKP